MVFSFSKLHVFPFPSTHNIKTKVWFLHVAMWHLFVVLIISSRHCNSFLMPDYNLKLVFLSQLMSVVVNRDWRDIVESCVLENWREALAALVTYAKAEEFTALCDLLGQRLEQEGDEHCSNAMVCYICAGNVEKFVSCW